jgi:hypothetical protein
MSLRDLLKRDDEVAEGDGSQPRKVVHYVRLPSREAAEAFAPMVLNQGFEPEIREPGPESADDPRPWTVAATSHMAVTEEAVALARRSFTELAAEYGGVYDSWEAAV